MSVKNISSKRASLTTFAKEHGLLALSAHCHYTFPCLELSCCLFVHFLFSPARRWLHEGRDMVCPGLFTTFTQGWGITGSQFIFTVLKLMDMRAQVKLEITQLFSSRWVWRGIQTNESMCGFRLPAFETEEGQHGRSVRKKESLHGIRWSWRNRQGNVIKGHSKEYIILFCNFDASHI